MSASSRMEVLEKNIFNLQELKTLQADLGGYKRYAHPKMRVFTTNQIVEKQLYFDLTKTVAHFKELLIKLREIHQEEKKILFVRNSGYSDDLLKRYIEDTGHFFVENKWKGGLLTNFYTLQKRVFKLQNIYNQIDKGLLDDMTKKEKMDFQEEKKSLEKNLKGILEMKTLPDYLFIIDPYSQKIAYKEAKKLGIPMFALLRTNFNPDEFVHFVPVNTGADKVIEKMLAKIRQFCFDKKDFESNLARREKEEPSLKQFEKAKNQN